MDEELKQRARDVLNKLNLDGKRGSIRELEAE
jgi:antitoxin component of RelBE/YafQ-DinJ toxin-antitoxin module